MNLNSFFSPWGIHATSMLCWAVSWPPAMVYGELTSVGGLISARMQPWMPGGGEGQVTGLLKLLLKCPTEGITVERGKGAITPPPVPNLCTRISTLTLLASEVR